MYAWLVKNRKRILILYCLKVLIFIPQVATADGGTVTCGTFSNGGYQIYVPSVWNGFNATTYQITGDVLDGVSGTGFWSISQFDTNIGTKIYTQPILYGSTGSIPSFATIQSEHGNGVYYFTSNVPYCGNGFAIFSLNDGIVTFLDTPPEINTSCITDATTRILDFSPLDNATTSNPVTFDLSACINPADIGTIKGINIRLHNYDQNVLLIGSLSPSDFEVLFDRNVQTSGLYQFSTSTTIGEGNYRIEACIDRSYLYGFIENPFSSVSTCESHQFVVGSSTYIGNISQRIFGETNTFLNGLSATSSEALASTCNPLGGNFGIRECTAFLFIPDGASMQAIVTDLKSGILTRPPIGYFTRFISILSNPATTTIPAWTASVQVGAGNNPTPEITTITIDPADMLAGGASLLDSIHDPITNKTARDVFYPMVQLAIALSVLMTIVADIAGSHRESERNKNV
jgi:hypothetical protein